MQIEIWLFAGLVILILYNLVSIPAIYFKRNDLADVLWGPALPITAWLCVIFLYKGLASLDLRAWLLLSFITTWGIRLFIHVGLRNLSHREEDVRYQRFRQEWGKSWLWKSYWLVFIFQGLILFICLSPVLLALSVSIKASSLIMWMGALIWLFGFVIEVTADRQLNIFKKDPRHKGQIMNQGLWEWSRHPNYFGEVTQWWGIWVMVVELPWGWFTVLSPIIITFLILKVTGVPLLEEHMSQRPGYAEYKQKTSRFLLRPPLK